ncbi:5-aminolevulinate synthase [Serratia proteamaculans]|uniref:5-aminolevulinate synthase n=1 Tax=Serratia proteamaculans TaxID=28151 RepID=UPI00217C9712|nr:5-aminolevulinate synthase [Serratia proteamaculans]CAI1103025.1 5-aminolevulinate synthase [Serratia proteamaculans]CAI1161101.1 5-aminolevulinate synthase [Serratia proteamaculans]
MSVLNILEKKLAETKKQGRFREFLNLERSVLDKPWATSHGQNGERRLNVWCSNDYLAMSHHPKVILATTEAVNRVGLGTCGARSISGTSIYHSELETLLASAYGKESALLFTTGFGANDATLSTLCDAIPDLIVFSDELNHASMIYGIRYSKAEKKIFRHNDVAHLAELLQAADPHRPKLIAFESLYSMDGDFAPLAQIVELAEQYQALTYLDEIHSAGVYGHRGLGYAEQLGLLEKITIVQGGFGKSYGAAGGYIAAPRVVVEAVRSWSPAFVFSTSSPAPVVAAALASFKYNLEHDNQRKHLLAIIDHLKSGLRAAGIPLVSEDSHILPVLVGDPHRNKHISKQLLDEYDIYVQPVNAPTVPAGSERLRVTPTSAHTHEDVEYFLAALSKVWTANQLRRAG